jgi:hypothetical protein
MCRAHDRKASRVNSCAGFFFHFLHQCCIYCCLCLGQGNSAKYPSIPFHLISSSFNFFLERKILKLLAILSRKPRWAKLFYQPQSLLFVPVGRCRIVLKAHQKIPQKNLIPIPVGSRLLGLLRTSQSSFRF